MLKMFFRNFLPVVAAWIVYASEFTANLPEPYKSAELLPIDDGGWYGNSPYLRDLIQKHEVHNVIEVGCWFGLSTRDIARLLPENGKVYAVDHWLGSAELQDLPKLPLAYQIFLSNAIQYGLAHKIIPVKMESTEAAKFLQGTPVDLIYIDGSHDTDSVLKDLKAWYPYVKGHGIICGDDAWQEGVLKAVNKFAEENNLKVYVDRNFWQLIE